MASGTELVYLHDGSARELETELDSIIPYSSLDEQNQALFASVDVPAEESYVLVVKATIFHPQGGGQPSDVGTMTGQGVTFQVVSARMNVIKSKQVLHCGRFTSGSASDLKPGSILSQAIDEEKRLLYSRYHTAGHVLGAAVRDLLGDKVADFDELKASHVPGSAACEFQGLIDGGHKADIQSAVDNIIAKEIPIQIVWWTVDDFRQKGFERLIPAGFDSPTEKLRVIMMEGLEAYPCGGTHVGTTNQCGQTTVTKIKRNKGTSRVSYSVAA